jgi:hypothetical protein
MGERADMLRNSLAAPIAFLLLLGALAAEAQPAIGDGSSNTIVFPEIPVEPEPPIDPCELDPRGCQPIDPCAANPLSCEAPPLVEPPAPLFAHQFGESARLKGQGFKTTQPYTLQMNFDIVALTFLAMDGDGTLYSGHLVPRGTQGTRFRLFLDGASEEAFAADVAARGAAAAGRGAGSALGESSKLTLKQNPDGSAALKIKSEVLVSGVGEVGFKANLSAAPLL